MKSFYPLMIIYLIFALPLRAQKIYVDADVIGGGNDGSSWGNAFDDLQEALAIVSDGDTIFVDEGTYYPTATMDRGISFFIQNDIVMLGGFSVDNGITHLAHRNPTLYPTILSGDINASGTVTDNSVSVVRTFNGDLVLDGFVIRDGYADITEFGSLESSSKGGALYISGGNVLLRNLVVSDNYALFEGGGLFVTKSTGSFSYVTVTNSIFENNTTDETGGAFYSSIVSDSVTVIDTRFIGNTAREGGGAVDLINTQYAIFTNVEYRGNVSNASGGGMSCSGSMGVLTNVLFSGNYASSLSTMGSGNGGGLSAVNGSRFTLINNTFSGNRAVNEGGGIFNGGGPNGRSILNVHNSIIWNNAAEGDPGTVSESVFNVTVGSVSELNYSNSTIENSGCTITCNISGGIDQGGNKDANPLFVSQLNPALAPSTGGDFHLTINSPAIDMGDGILLPNNVITDLDSVHRIQGGEVDMGVYEFPDECIHHRVLYVDAMATGLNNGRTWANAFTDLQDALQYCGYDSIYVSRGTYYPDGSNSGAGTGARDHTFGIPDGVVVLGGFDAQNGIINLSQRDWEAYPTVLSGNIGDVADSLDNSYHVVTTVDTVSSATVIDGFIIRDGMANDISSGKSNGAGWYNSGSPKLSNILFTNNVATSNGGGMNNNTNASPSMYFVSFWNNKAGNVGGGLNLSEGSGLVAMINCSFRGNTGIEGGGLYNYQTEVVIINNEFSGNMASQNGGGISGLEANMSIVNTTFAFNNASLEGGGIFHRDFFNSNSIINIANTIFFGNTAMSSPSIYTSPSNTTNISFTLFDQGLCPTNANCSGGGNKFGMDPQFMQNPSVPPSIDGDLSLHITSPAINMGSTMAYQSAGGPNIDLDSMARIVESDIEMGAYEVLTCHDVSVLYVDAEAVGQGTGLNWMDAFTTLQEALSYNCNYDSIFVNRGTYYADGGTGIRDSSFNIPSGKVVLGGFNVEIGATTFADRSPQIYNTILSGQIGNAGDNSYHVLTFYDTDSNTVLDGFIISDGRADLGNLDDDDRNRGGGILLDNSHPILNDLYITNNISARDGGGIANVNSSSPTMTKITLVGNTARDGGGIANLENSNPSLLNVSIIMNSALSGGGIYNHMSSPEVGNSMVQGNTADRSGGGVINNLESNSTFTNVLIAGNTSEIDGGGMANYNSSPVLTNVTISGNRAGTGIMNSGGMAINDGGGIYNFADSDPVIHNSIIFYNEESMTDGSTSASIYNESNSDDRPMISNSIIENSHDIGGNWVGIEIGVDNGGNKDINPEFVAPMDHSSAPTIEGDYSLQNISPAIDMGDSMLYHGGVVDLADVDRIQNMDIDMGPYEVSTVFCPGTVIPVLYVDGQAPPGGDGMSWATAFVDLQDALLYPCPFDSIYVSAGTYFPTDGIDRNTYFAVPDGVVLLGGFNTTTGDSTLISRNWEAYPTILSGNIGSPIDETDNSIHVMTMENISDETLVDGFVLRDGYANGGLGFNRGGGIDISQQAMATIRNCIVENNFANSGGGINIGTSSRPRLENVVIRNNTSNDDGGGMRLDNTTNGPPLLVNVQFSGNIANNIGGGLYLFGGNASVNIVNSTFSGNSAGSNGGAIGIEASVVNLDNSIVWNNSASGINSHTSASLFNSITTSGGIAIENSIVDNSGGSGTWAFADPSITFDGLVLDEDPLFIQDLPPGTAPSASGEFGLQPGSPGVNMGDNTLYPMTAPDYDLAEMNRTIDGIVDMGAYENTCGLSRKNLYVDQSVAMSGDGLSWATAFADLQDALNYDCLIDTVFVAEGSYYPDGGTMDRTLSFDIPEQLVLLGGFPSGGASLLGRDWMDNPTILSGEIGGVGITDNSYNVMTITDVNEAYIDGIQIKGGNADLNSFPYNVGGGIFMNTSFPTFNNVLVEGNQSNSNGGGIYAQSSVPIMYNSIIRNNYSNLIGGGFSGNGTRLTIVNSVIQGNAAAGDAGGIHLLNGGGNSRIINSTFSGNDGGGDGGGFLSNNTNTIIANSIIWNNSDNGGNTDLVSSSIVCLNNTVTVVNSMVDNSGGSSDWMFGINVIDGGYNQDTFPEFIENADPSTAPNAIGDLRLKITSPAISMGSDTEYLVGTFPTGDLDNVNRFLGGSIDMGAFEQVGCSDLVNLALYVDSAATGLADGLSWDNAFTTLQDALMFPCDFDTIYVSKGTYYPDQLDGVDSDDLTATFQIPNGVVLFGGFNTLTMDTTLVSRNPICNPTVLSGLISGSAVDTIYSLHVVTTENVSSTTSMDGFFIRNGFARNASSSLSEYGGGWLNIADGVGEISSPQLSNVYFVENFAQLSGGGFASVSLNDGVAEPGLTNVSFSLNRANSQGGAIFANNFSGTSSRIQITNGVFIDNTTLYSGGAIFMGGLASASISELDVKNSTFIGNDALVKGGAIAYEAIDGATTSVEVVNSLFVDNDFTNEDIEIVPVTGPPLGITPPAVVKYSLFSGHCPVDAQCDLNTQTNADPEIVEIDSKMGRVYYETTSSIIDMGSNLLYSGPSIDVGGKDRITDGDGDASVIIDIGAHEQSTSICMPFAGSIVYVDSSATGDNNGSSWANAFTDLQDGLLTLTCNDVDTVFVAAGTYYPAATDTVIDECSGEEMILSPDRKISFVIPDNAIVFGGFPNGGGSERDHIIHRTILSGKITDSTNSYHVVRTENVSNSSRVDGFIIRDGVADGPGEAEAIGGGWLNIANGEGGGSFPIISNIIFQNNFASVGGGGLANLATDDDAGGAFLNDVVFVENGGYSGGAVYNSALGGVIELAISDALFIQNTANSGGGIYTVGGSGYLASVTVTNSSFVENFGLAGGGILAEELIGGDVQIDVRNSLFYDNNSSSSNGESDDIGQSLPILSPATLSVSSSMIDGPCPANTACDLSTKLNADPEIDAIEDSAEPNYSGKITFSLSSPVIDMGDNNLYFGLEDSLDLVGNIRFVDGDYNGTSIIDIGAHEVPAEPCNPFAGAVIYVDSAAMGENTGLSWADAFTDLQDALHYECDVDTIFVSKGSYYPTSVSDRSISFELLNDVVMLGGFDVSKGDTLFTDRNWETNKTILSGNIQNKSSSSDNSYTVLYAYHLTDTTVIDGFIIADGNSDSGVQRNGKGGGMYMDDSDLNLRNILFTNNTARSNGGGMYGVYTSQPTFTNITFNENTSGVDGGGLSLYNPNPVMTDVYFYNNIASDDGGGLELKSSDAIITNMVICGNSAGDNGGGIYIDEGNPIITNAIISGNETKDYGGGMYNDDARPQLINVTITGNNVIDDSGGGIWNGFGGISTLINCIVWNNAINGVTNTPAASIDNSSGSNSICEYSIIAHSGGSGSWVNSIGINGGNNIDEDPMFVTDVDLLNLPTCTGDLRLLPSSPAIDMGDSSAYHGFGGPGLDLNNNDRILQNQIDMGAIEYVDCPNDTLICRDVYVQLDTAGMAVLTPEQFIDPQSFDTVFSYTGGLQSLTIPSGVTSVYIEAAGGRGGRGSRLSSIGGNGAVVGGHFSVTTGDVIQIIVAGAGVDGAANVDGGGGGGASFVARGSVGFSDFISSNIMVIAGGGGGGFLGINGVNSTTLQAGPSGSGGNSNVGGGGGGSAMQDGGGPLGGSSAINGSIPGNRGGFGGGGGVSTNRSLRIGGGGGGATGGDAVRGNNAAPGMAGTSFNNGEYPIFIPAANADTGFVRIIYNYAVSETITLSTDTVFCDAQSSPISVLLAKTNCDGSIDTCVAQVRAIDVIPPTVSAPEDIMVYCDQMTTTQVTGMATAEGIDSCGIDTIEYRDIKIDNICTDTIIRIFTAVDYSQNMSVPDTQIITILDTIPPILICPVDDTIQCGTTTEQSITVSSNDIGEVLEDNTQIFELPVSGIEDVLVRVELSVEINTDNVNDLYINLISPSGSSKGAIYFDGAVCNGSNIVATFTDTAVATYTDFDNECNANNPAKGPGFYKPYNDFDVFAGDSVNGTWLLYFENDGPMSANLVSWSITFITESLPIFYDDCSEATITIESDSSGLTGCGGSLGTIRRTIIAADGCNNVDTCVQIINMVDTIAPVLLEASYPRDTSVSCITALDTMTLGRPTYTDATACNSDLMITYSDRFMGLDGTCNNDTVGIILRKFFASDCAGNIDSSFVSRIVLIDTLGPKIVSPTDFYVSCDEMIYQPTGYNTTVIKEVNENLPQYNVKTILDTITLNAATGVLVQNVLLGLDVSHPEPRVVKVSLTSPSGTTVDLIEDLNSAPDCPQSDIDVRLYDRADNGFDDYVNQCSVASPEKQGDFQPENPLSRFNGESISGDWIIAVHSNFSTPTGHRRFNSWSLTVSDGGITLDDCTQTTTTFSDDTLYTYNCNAQFEILRTFTATDDCGNMDSDSQRIIVFNPIPEMQCPVDTTVDCGSDTSVATLGLPVVMGNCSVDAAISHVYTETYPGKMATYGYGIISSNSSSDSLVRINVNTGEQTIIADIDVNVESLSGGEFINGKYYISANDHLYTVDTTTGGLTPILSINDRFYGMDEDPTTAILYGIAPPFGTMNLYKIDLVTHAVSLIGVNSDITEAVWLTIDPAGNAFVLDAATDAIYRIDLSSGQTIELVTPINDGVNPIDVAGTGDAEFVTTTKGTAIYGNLKTLPSGDNYFGKYNLKTGEFDILEPTQTFLAAFASPGPTVINHCPVVQTIVRTFIAQDDCGGRNFCDQIIEVQDTTGPIFQNLKDTLILVCISDTIGLASNLVIDECNLDTLFYEDIYSTSGCIDTIFRKYTAIDKCNNSSSDVQIIIVGDTIPPQPLSCPPISFINCAIGQPLPMKSPSYVDNCSPADSLKITTRIDSVGFETVSVEDDTIFIQYLAEDLCGNVDSSCTQVLVCLIDCPTINCQSTVNLGMGSGCSVDITPDVILTQPLHPALLPYIEITVQNEYGAYLAENVLTYEDRGQIFTVTIRSQIPGCEPRFCQSKIILDNGPVPLSFISAWQNSPDIDEMNSVIAPRASSSQRINSGSNISEGKINVYCWNIPDPSDHIPSVFNACTGESYSPQVQPDWVMPVDCERESDTAKVIFRTWEVFDKSGSLYLLTDTIVVFRLPKLTPESFVVTAEDSSYCEIEAVSNEGESLKRYAAWKQPVGLHDYELPYAKLKGLTYELPAAVIIAGMENASAQGEEVFEEYLECVILKKASGAEITIGDIVSGDYMDELLSSLSQKQLGYGFLQGLVELSEDPINI
ncbi:choice-of-anchor Q domain-containing protein, partial [Membranihabitans marinus]|uniref:choice-of-anchor Q domain-containing protein n=1 Tax=Membranihabitans marinus TaxID=1227546 RepID=UPI001F02D5A1